MITEEERREAASEEPSVWPPRGMRRLPGGFDGVERAEVGKMKAKAIKHPGGFALQLEKDGRKIVGVIERVTDSLTDETYPYKYIATVYEGERVIFAIDTCPFGLALFRKILKGAMNNAIIAMGHSRRNRRNRAARAERQAHDNN